MDRQNAARAAVAATTPATTRPTGFAARTALKAAVAAVATVTPAASVPIPITRAEIAETIHGFSSTKSEAHSKADAPVL